MGTLLIFLLVLMFGLILVAALITFLKEGRIEVDPMSAVVFKNLWTGWARAILPGTRFIIPGVEKRLVDVTLKNEPADPPLTHVVTADPIQIGVDYIIYTFQIPRDAESIVKAATAIDYGKRKEVSIDRIEAELQAAFGQRQFAVVYAAGSGVNRQTLQDIAREVNVALAASVEAEWGIHVEIRIEDVDFPGKIQEAIEEAVTAPREGAAIKQKADAAGVQPQIIAIGEMVVDAIAAFRGKGGDGRREKK